MDSTTVVPGSRGGQSAWARFVTTDEQYGGEVVQAFLKEIEPPESVMDLGAGAGAILSW